MSAVKIIECPRDAMQGIKEFIPTEKKVRYLQSLLSVGFDTLDFGSFVSEKAIPQMRDTKEILKQLDLTNTTTKLLAIVANVRGAEEALKFSEIQYFGYPFSMSEIFQMRNTGKTIATAFDELKQIFDLTQKHNKKLVVYLSMGFGNPYGEHWNKEIVLKWANNLIKYGIDIISLSDTIGNAKPFIIEDLFSNLITNFPQIEFGAHFHTLPDMWFEKIDAAYSAGCRRFDGAIKGFGGCPMAKDDLTGNMPTEKMLSYFASRQIKTKINILRFESAYNEALMIF